MTAQDSREHAELFLKLIENDQLTRSLVAAIDAQSKNASIREQCRVVLNECNKMSWFSKVKGILQTTIIFLLIPLMTSFISLVHAIDQKFGWHAWHGWFNLVVFVISTTAFFVIVHILSKIGKRENEVIVKGSALSVLYDGICEFKGELSPYGIKTAEDAIGLMGDICFEIVHIESLGLPKGARFANPFPKPYRDVQIVNHIQITLDDLRLEFKKLVWIAGIVEFTTGDLGVHYAAAKKRLDEKLASGELGNDYVI